MNSMLKKTLLAASVAATFGVNAADIIPADTSSMMGVQLEVISAEGFAIAGAITVGTGDDDVQVRITPEIVSYDSNDILVFTFTGANVSDDTALADVVLLLNGSPVAQGLGIEGNVVRLGLIDTDTTEDGEGFQNPLLTDADEIEALDLSGVILEDITGTVSVAYNGLRQNTSIDGAAQTAVVTLASQFSAEVADELDGVVDVEADRQAFTGDAIEDAFTVTLNSGADLLSVTADQVEFDITGEDLSFLVDDEGDLLAGQVDVVNGTVTTSTDTLNDDGSVNVVVAGTDVSGETTITLQTVTGDDAPVLEAPQSFSADLDVQYRLTPNGTPGSVSFNGLDIGAWTLSGATVNIPFMPYGSGIGQIIHISNEGDVTGDIEITAFDDDGESYGPVTLSVAAQAGTVTRIGGAIRAALIDAGFSGAGNLDITMVVNSPAEDIDVFAAYNVRGDRVNAIAQPILPMQ